MFSDDRCIRELNSAESACQQIAEKIRNRDQHQRGSRAYIRNNQDVQQGLSKVAVTLQSLTQLINQQSITGEITEHEATRRLTRLRGIESRFADLEHSARTDARENFMRNELLSQRGEAADRLAVPTATWEEARESSDGSIPVTVQESVQAQRQYMNDQDAGLEQLSSIVSRTKTIAQDFTTELDLHHEILDDVTEQTDRANERLIHNTQRTRELGHRSDTCGLWVIIVLLLIAIIIIAVI